MIASKRSNLKVLEIKARLEFGWTLNIVFILLCNPSTGLSVTLIAAKAETQ